MQIKEGVQGGNVGPWDDGYELSAGAPRAVTFRRVNSFPHLLMQLSLAPVTRICSQPCHASPLSAGVAVVSAGGAIWPAGQRSMCGDSATLAQPRPHEAGGVFWTGAVPPASVFTEGQVANLTIRLTANHMGRFTFRICRVTGTDVAAEQAQLTQACLDEHILLQANTPDAQVRIARPPHCVPAHNSTRQRASLPCSRQQK